MSYNLFLDDVREPEEAFGYTNNQLYLIGWKIARNYDEFVKMIEEYGIPEILSFDHDLAHEHYHRDMYKGNEYNKLYDNFQEKTGYDCAKWLINYCINNHCKLPETILIHSMNPAGKENIKSIINNYIKSLS